jgi:transposase
MRAFLARHAYCGRRSPAELVSRLRAAPLGTNGDPEAEAKGECVRALVAVLRPLVTQLQVLTAAVEHAVEAHPDGSVVASLFRAGRVCAAQILAELGDDRARFASAEHLAAEAGVAPITRASGKHAASASAGPATNGCAPRSPASPTARARPRHGRLASTSGREHAAATIPTPAASWRAPGAASCGAAGRRASRTTLESTP